MLFREDIITATTNTCTLQEDLRWHTEWECNVLSRITAKEDTGENCTQVDKDNLDSNVEQVNTSHMTDKNADIVETHNKTKLTDDFYNLVFPLRFMALKWKSPHLYEQIMDLESHLTERKRQVISNRCQLSINKKNINGYEINGYELKA